MPGLHRRDRRPVVSVEPRPLLVLPLPLEARAAARIMRAIAAAWELEHRGERMTMGHMITGNHPDFGTCLVIYPVPVLPVHHDSWRGVPSAAVSRVSVLGRDGPGR